MAVGTAANSKKSARKPPPGRPFQKGQSGNPKGRPKVHAEYMAALRAHLPDAIERLNALSEAGDVSATIKLIEWGVGKPAAAPEDHAAMASAASGLAVLSTAEIVKAVRTLNEPKEDE